MASLSLKSLDRRVSAIEVARKNGAQVQLAAAGKLKKGEIDVGYTIHDGQPARLILMPERADRLTWDEAQAWAKKNDGELPSRIDALILFQRARDKFETSERPSYWTGEQYANDPSCAWHQWFYNGDHYHWNKVNKIRACLVRRVPIR